MKLITYMGVSSSFPRLYLSFLLAWKKYTSVLVACLFILSSGYVAAAPLLYRVIDLGDLPGGNSDSVAYGINNLGQVVGSGNLGSASAPNAFFWQNGHMTSLGDLPGGVERSEAFAINDSGQIIGRGTSSASI